MTISTEEANALFHFKKKVLDKGFSCEVDRIELASCCEAFYSEFLGLDVPSVFIADGPEEAMTIFNHVVGKNLSDKHQDIIKFGGFSSSLSVRKDIDHAVFDLVKSSKLHLKEAVGNGKFKEIRNILFRDLNFQFSQSVYQLVEKGFYHSSKMVGKVTQEFAAHPSFADLDWVNFYKGCSKVFGLNDFLSDSYSRFIDSGLFSGYFYRDFAVLVTLPSCLHKNENLVLHHDDESAVRWMDGTNLAFWNGIEVPQKLICDPDSITAADILCEMNAEVRRCYQEKLGSERFGNLLGLMALDKKIDRFGNELILYRTKTMDRLAGDFIYFAKVVCPSTGRNYFLCVPPGLSGVEEAVSWTFGKSSGDYRPSIET